MSVLYNDPKGTIQHKPSGAVLYGEASYFDGYHFAHIAAYQIHLLMTRQRSKLLAWFERNHHP